MKRVLASGLTLLATAAAQQVGTEEAETHPALTWSDCSSGSCEEVSASVVIDANWRWVHELDGYENCYEGNDWTDKCSSAEDCATNCALEGADYEGTYGISTSGDALTLKFTQTDDYGTNVGSRVYLMNGEDKYQMFTLMDNEFAFDVDLSAVECGMNSALYFVPMKEDGGLSDEENNAAGAQYGLGYCDAQCARDLKFINGKVSLPSLTSSPFPQPEDSGTNDHTRATSRAGSPARPTTPPVSAAWAPAAPRSTSGSPTRTPSP